MEVKTHGKSVKLFKLYDVLHRNTYGNLKS